MLLSVFVLNIYYVLFKNHFDGSIGRSKQNLLANMERERKREKPKKKRVLDRKNLGIIGN